LGTVLRFILAHPLDHDINGQWSTVVGVRHEVGKTRQCTTHAIQFKAEAATLDKVFIYPGL
jgi:hypothetical protein